MNALWKYDVSSNVWMWINGYSVSGIPRSSTIPYYRGAMGFAVDDSESYVYIFGGQFPGISTNNGFIGKLVNFCLLSDMSF
jgi:hypothetical protein